VEIAYYGHGRVGSLCREVAERRGVNILGNFDFMKRPDFLISVHWPKVFTAKELARPKHGCLNLHNSYLPWNRGAHPCTWALIDQTPHGVTMHWMDEGIDTGDIFLQERLFPEKGETAHELYQRTVELEVKLFEKALDQLWIGRRDRKPQVGIGSFHKKADFKRLELAMTTSDCKVIREA